MRIRDVSPSIATFALACALWTAVPTPVSAAAPAEDVFADMGVEPISPPAQAPDLALQAADGSSIRLSQFRGKVVVLEFFVTT